MKTNKPSYLVKTSTDTDLPCACHLCVLKEHPRCPGNTDSGCTLSEQEYYVYNDSSEVPGSGRGVFLNEECKVEIIIPEAEKKLPDSGERLEHSTGSVREPNKNKLRYDLIPPECIKRMAQHYQAGALKYSERNWEKGLPLMDTYASLMRHVMAWAEGKTDEDHLAAIVWNAFCLMFTERSISDGSLPKELDDRPYYMLPKINNLSDKIAKYSITEECDKMMEVLDKENTNESESNKKEIGSCPAGQAVPSEEN